MSSPRRLLPLVLMIAFSFSLTFAAGADGAVGELWRQPLPAAAQAVRVDTDCIAIWSEADGGGAVLRAVRYGPSGQPDQLSPATLVTAPAAIDTLIAAPDNEGGVLLVWRTGGVTAVQRFDDDLAAVYPALAVCSDTAVAARYGAGATASPLAAGAGPDGGAFVALTLAGASGEPASLLERVSPGGTSAAADPGSHFAGRIADMAVGLDGRARVLFWPAPGAGLKLQCVRADLSRAWNPAVTLTSDDVVAIGLIAADHAVAAWRRGGHAYALRVTKDGGRAWRRPVTITPPPASGTPLDAALCKDELSGATISAIAGGTLQVSHFDAAGHTVGLAGGRTIQTGLDDGEIAGVWSDRSGRLSVAVNGSSGGAPAAVLERLSYLGAPLPTPAGIAGEEVTSLTGDESGDLQIATLGAAGAAVARVGETGRAISCEPNYAEIVYGQRVHFGGYALDGALPLAGRSVRLGWSRSVAVAPAGATATGTTERFGFWTLEASPKVNAWWTASVSAPPASGRLESTAVRIGVHTRVIAFFHRRAAGAGVAITGAVIPDHAGRTVRLERRTQAGWRTFLTRKLDSHSRFTFAWRPAARPRVSVMRVFFPAHSDHLAGASPSLTVRVQVK